MNRGEADERAYDGANNFENFSPRRGCWIAKVGVWSGVGATNACSGGLILVGILVVESSTRGHGCLADYQRAERPKWQLDWNICSRANSGPTQCAWDASWTDVTGVRRCRSEEGCRGWTRITWIFWTEGSKGSKEVGTAMIVATAWRAHLKRGSAPPIERLRFRGKSGLNSGGWGQRVREIAKEREG